MECIDVFDENNNPIGEVKEKIQAHEDGNFHRTAHVWIINDKNELLLQKRSANKKLWPNMWDVTVGGHVDRGEFGRQALIRETKEELGIEISDEDIKYLVGSTSINEQGDIINKHYNECYLITKNIDVSNIVIQKEEVSEVKYFSREELIKRIDNNYEGLTEKIGAWNFLKKILERYAI